MHVENGANMTGFGGWDMPLYYGEGIMKEHLWCRENAGLFDVSHMLGIKITGEDRVQFAERFLPANVAELNDGEGCLTNIPNANGGLIDDCIITNAGDHLFLVINAGHEEKDIPHMEKVLNLFDGTAAIEPQEGKGILALQGPKAVDALAKMTDGVDFTTWKFMTGRNLTVNGVSCFVTRSGYTGEDGFEISCNGADAAALSAALCEDDNVKLIGLGARDSLRLEAGLCLYGNDIDDETDPVEAGLLWTIGKRRRTEGGFVGADKILAIIADRKNLVKRKRVGLTLAGKGPPPRSGDLLFNEEGEQIGQLTSGVFGPSAKKAVAMGYVEKKYGLKSFKGTVKVQIRKKQFDMKVTPMPFHPTNFFGGK
jgi:aminomethyltransferase